jgi:uncharacterized protein YfaS (alpha-2-macroglobulin family)
MRHKTPEYLRAYLSGTSIDLTFHIKDKTFESVTWPSAVTLTIKDATGAFLLDDITPVDQIPITAIATGVYEHTVFIPESQAEGEYTARVDFTGTPPERLCAEIDIHVVKPKVSL